MSKQTNKTAMAIRSEMTPTKAAIPTKRAPTSVRLREYEDGNSTTAEMVQAFLEDVYGATRMDIVGATGAAWAAVCDALEELEQAGKIRIHKNVSPWEYRWKH